MIAGNVERAADWLLAGRAQHLPAEDAPEPAPLLAEPQSEPEPEPEAASEPEPEAVLESAEEVGAAGWFKLCAAIDGHKSHSPCQRVFAAPNKLADGDDPLSHLKYSTGDIIDTP